jgi:hypothetical protein
VVVLVSSLKIAKNFGENRPLIGKSKSRVVVYFFENLPLLGQYPFPIFERQRLPLKNMGERLRFSPEVKQGTFYPRIGNNTKAHRGVLLC